MRRNQLVMEHARITHAEKNINDPERWVSVVFGSALAAYGLKMRSLGGLVLSAIGGSLVWRGATGHCPIYGGLGISSAEENGRNVSVPYGHGVRVEKAVTINAPVENVYAFWRNFENLPRFMHYLESVTTSEEGTKSHWVAKAPAGTTVAWDAELIEDRPNELIRWRSLDGSQVETTGSVEFRAAPQARGTEVHVDLTYNPPGGRWGATLASLFGRSGEQEVREDLRRFKRFLETGELPTTKGQPHGKCML